MNTQLKAGIEVEKEHAKDLGPYTDLSKNEIAKLIAQGHITQDSEYYSKLVKAGLVDEKEAVDILDESIDLIPQTLYHATYKARLKSIMLHGLLTSPPVKRSWSDSDTKVYLADNPHEAESYAESSEEVPEGYLDQIVILKINVSQLNPNSLSIDTNNQTGTTFEYSENIPPRAISIFKSKRVSEAFALNVPPSGKRERIWYDLAWKELNTCITWCSKFNVTTYNKKLPNGYQLSMHWNSAEEVTYKVTKPSNQEPKVYASGTLDIANKFNESLTWSGHKLSYRTKFQGINISIENRKGSIRRGTAPDGTKWETKMTMPYGYIRGTIGFDGDHLDCFIGPNKKSSRVFVVHQKKESGEFDEDKVMFGFDDEESAKAGYLSNYDTDIYFDGVEMLTLDEFKDFVFKHKGKKVTLQDTAPLKEGMIKVPQRWIDEVNQQVIRPYFESHFFLKALGMFLSGCLDPEEYKEFYTDENEYNSHMMEARGQFLIGRQLVLQGIEKLVTAQTTDRYAKRVLSEELKPLVESMKPNENWEREEWNSIQRRVCSILGAPMFINEYSSMAPEFYRQYFISKEIILSKKDLLPRYNKTEPSSEDIRLLVSIDTKEIDKRSQGYFQRSERYVSSSTITLLPKNNPYVERLMKDRYPREVFRDTELKTNQTGWDESAVNNAVSSWNSIVAESISKIEDSLLSTLEHELAHLLQYKGTGTLTKNLKNYPDMDNPDDDQQTKATKYYNSEVEKDPQIISSVRSFIGPRKLAILRSPDARKAFNSFAKEFIEDSSFFQHLAKRSPQRAQKYISIFYKEAWDVIASELDKEAMKENTQPRLAPNGKPSNLSPYLYQIVRTPTFKAWFGDWENNVAGKWDSNSSSRCVDKNGEPLVVYHGTGIGFSKFEVPGEEIESKTSHSTSAIYFTISKEMASEFAGGEPHEKQIKPCFLNIRKAFNIDFGKRDWYDIQEIFDDEINNRMDMGYDGGIALVMEGKHKEPQWIIFSPKNVKSIYNKGTFKTDTTELSESIELEEAKNYGDLYHFTTTASAMAIATKGIMATVDNKQNYYLSLTRNPHANKAPYLAYKKVDCALVFDGNKISNLFKIGPFLDTPNNIKRTGGFGFSAEGYIPHGEAEERVYLNTPKKREVITDLIKGVLVLGDKSDSGRSLAYSDNWRLIPFEDWVMLFQNRAQNHLGRVIPVEFVPVTDNVASHLIKSRNKAKLPTPEVDTPQKKKSFLSNFMKESFSISTVQDKSAFFDIFKNSYMKATGSSWDRHTFDMKSKYWTFYGTEFGAIAVSSKRLPFSALKITAMFGDMAGVSAGLKEFFSSMRGRKPVFALVDDRIGGFLERNFNLTRIPQELISPYGKEIYGMLGAGPHDTMENNGGGTLDFEGKEVVKYIVGNKYFYRGLFNHLPEDIKNSAIMNQYKSY